MFCAGLRGKNLTENRMKIILRTSSSLSAHNHTRSQLCIVRVYHSYVNHCGGINRKLTNYIFRGHQATRYDTRCPSR